MVTIISPAGYRLEIKGADRCEVEGKDRASKIMSNEEILMVVPHESGWIVLGVSGVLYPPPIRGETK